MASQAAPLAIDEKTEVVKYVPIPTIAKFHADDSDVRCIVGPVGSAKTTGAAWEICYFLPKFLKDNYNIKRTRWCVVRNTYTELIDTTQATVFDWFSWGDYEAQRKRLTLYYPEEVGGMIVEILFRSCDRVDDVKKFKSLELTGYWIDESIEVAGEIKRMLKNRIGRYPRKCPRRYGIETTNPPDVEHETYTQFNWGDQPPPGPIPEGEPLINHRGFWQPPRENEPNLRVGYYDDLINDYKDDPDWAEMYVQGKPGIIVKGKLVYVNFQRKLHVAAAPLAWAKGTLYRGWDNSGNIPACVIVQQPTVGHLQVIKEFCGDVHNIADFTRMVVMTCNELYPNAEYIDWGDPAGANKFSTKEGGFTSNAQIMQEAAGVVVVSSDQNFTARVDSIDSALGRIDGLLINPSCVRLINGFMGGYHYKEIGGIGTGIWSPDPVKNRFSHIHDALQYVILKLVRSNPEKKMKKTVPNRQAKSTKMAIRPSRRSRRVR